MSSAKQGVLRCLDKTNWVVLVTPPLVFLSSYYVVNTYLHLIRYFSQHTPVGALHCANNLSMENPSSLCLCCLLLWEAITSLLRFLFLLGSTPMIKFWNLMKFPPCNGLVMKSTTISPVDTILREARRSLPYPSQRNNGWWYAWSSYCLRPCQSSPAIHCEALCMSSTATSLLSVELLVLSLCFQQPTIGKPVPIVSPPRVCPLMSGCTVNDATTYHSRTPWLSAPILRVKSFVSHKYSTRCWSFLQSSTSGSMLLPPKYRDLPAL